MRGTCPACGKGKLFTSFLEIAECFNLCGLPFGAHEQGDGPAFFGVLLVGALAAIGATILEVKFSPPYWVHLVVWLPFIVGGSVLSLRVLKAAIIAAQYQYRKDDFK